MADSTVRQPKLQYSDWQVDRFIVSTSLVGLAVLGGVIWLETAPLWGITFAFNVWGAKMMAAAVVGSLS